MAVIKFAVVACGNIGKRHLAVIDSQDRADLVGVCDIMPERVRAAAEQY